VEQEEPIKLFVEKTTKLFKSHLKALTDLKARVIANEILLMAALLHTKDRELICAEAEQMIDSMPPEEDEFLGGIEVHSQARRRVLKAIEVLRGR